MGKYCSDCRNFNTSKKKDNVDGLCYCGKVKDYVFGNMVSCDKFDEAYSRNWFEKEKLYDDGKRASESVSGDVNWFLPIILIVLLIVLKILGYV